MNYLGREKRHTSMRHLCVNKNGFISMYALMILSVFLLFSSFMVQRIYTYAKIVKNVESSMLLDIFVLHTIKTHLEKQEIQDKEEEEEQGDHVDHLMKKNQTSNEHDEHNEEYESSEYTWEGVYRDIEFTFKEEVNMIRVQFMYHQEIQNIEVIIAEDTKEIMNYAYVT